MASPKCGKCGSGNVYWDDDGVGTVLACRKCGHRTPPPVVINKTGEEGKMPKKPCSNCGRVMWIVRDDRCSYCSNAAGDLEGDELDKALADAAERVKNGEVRKGIGGCRKKGGSKKDKARSPGHDDSVR